MKVFKVAVIGCGRIAGHNCRAIINTPGLELAAVCDLEIEKARVYQDEFKVPAYSNYHTMLEKVTDIDIVAIITPSGLVTLYISLILLKSCSIPYFFFNFNEFFLVLLQIPTISIFFN